MPLPMSGALCARHAGQREASICFPGGVFLNLESRPLPFHQLEVYCRERREGYGNGVSKN